MVTTDLFLFSACSLFLTCFSLTVLVNNSVRISAYQLRAGLQCCCEVALVNRKTMGRFCVGWQSREIDKIHRGVVFICQKKYSPLGPAGFLEKLRLVSLFILVPAGGDFICCKDVSGSLDSHIYIRA